MSILNSINKRAHELMLEKLQFNYRDFVQQIIMYDKNMQVVNMQQITEYIHKQVLFKTIKNNASMKQFFGIPIQNDDINQFLELRFLAEGANGIAFKIINKQSQIVHLLKSIQCQYDEDAQQIIFLYQQNESIRKEFNISKELEKHDILSQYIKHPLYLFTYGPIVYSVYEYLEGYSLQQIIEKEEQLSNQEINQILQQLMKISIHFYEFKLVLHNDIKLDNFIYNSHTGKLYIIDFGAAHMINNIQNQIYDICQQERNIINDDQKKRFIQRAQNQFKQNYNFQGALFYSVNMKQVVDNQITQQQFIDMLFKNEILTLLINSLCIFHKKVYIFQNVVLQQVFQDTCKDYGFICFNVQLAIFKGTLLEMSLQQYQSSLCDQINNIEEQFHNTLNFYQFQKFGPSQQKLLQKLRLLQNSKDQSINECFTNYIHGLNEENVNQLNILINYLNM